MYEFRVYLLRDGTKKVIKTIQGESFGDEVQRAGIKQTEILQTHLVEENPQATQHRKRKATM